MLSMASMSRDSSTSGTDSGLQSATSIHGVQWGSQGRVTALTVPLFEAVLPDCNLVLGLKHRTPRLGSVLCQPSPPRRSRVAPQRGAVEVGQTPCPSPTTPPLEPIAQKGKQRYKKSCVKSSQHASQASTLPVSV